VVVLNGDAAGVTVAVTAAVVPNAPNAPPANGPERSAPNAVRNGRRSLSVLSKKNCDRNSRPHVRPALNAVGDVKSRHATSLPVRNPHAALSVRLAKRGPRGRDALPAKSARFVRNVRPVKNARPVATTKVADVVARNVPSPSASPPGMSLLPSRMRTIRSERGCGRRRLRRPPASMTRMKVLQTWAKVLQKQKKPRP